MEICIYNIIKKDSVGTLKSQNGSVVSDPTEKSEIFNHQFKSVFTIEDTDYFPIKGPPSFLPIEDIKISTAGVFKLISNCNSGKSVGPDNIHACFLKNTEDNTIADSHFQLSLRTGVLPSVWKQAYVTPISRPSEAIQLWCGPKKESTKVLEFLMPEYTIFIIHTIAIYTMLVHTCIY